LQRYEILTGGTPVKISYKRKARFFAALPQKMRYTVPKKPNAPALPAGRIP
jgi:hypothetical protein